MCAFPITGFSHFVGIEQENLMTSVANLGDDYFLIHNMDILYMSCCELKIGEEEQKIPAFLYLIVHSEFHNAMASYLRLHKSKSFRSLRASLDSAFTAYYLLKHPDKTDIYLSKITEEENPEWKRIFLNIKRTIKDNIANFPLAEALPDIHEFCSIYSHSDALGIFHKYNLDRERSLLEAKYFDYESSVEDYKRWLGYLLFTFYRIYMIYWNEIFKQRAEDKLSEIENNIMEYDKRIRTFIKQYPLKSE